MQQRGGIARNFAVFAEVSPVGVLALGARGAMEVHMYFCLFVCLFIRLAVVRQLIWAPRSEAWKRNASVHMVTGRRLTLLHMAVSRVFSINMRRQDFLRWSFVVCRNRNTALK